MNEVHWVTSEEEFDGLLETSDVAMVAFTAPKYCQPCRALEPHFKTAAEKSSETFVAVDLDSNPWAAVKYDILTVPTVYLFRDGTRRTVQARTSIKLLNEIEEDSKNA